MDTAVALTGIIALGLLVAAVDVVHDFVKMVTNGEWRDAGSQVLAFLLGIGVVWLSASASLFDGVGLPLGDGTELVLSTLNFPSIVFLGVLVGAVGTQLFDLKATFDSTRVVRKLPLFPKPDPGLLEPVETAKKSAKKSKKS